MKKIILFLLSAVMMVSLSGCDAIEDIFGEDRIVDWAPVNLYMKVTDSQGIDLLDPENPDNMIDGTTITYKGNTYEARREKENPILETRALPARFYGLYLAKDARIYGGTVEGYCLVFGEIDGAANMDEDLVVTLPNGTTGTIHYHCSKHNERKVSCKRYYKFNGVKTDKNIFTFVVPN